MCQNEIEHADKVNDQRRRLLQKTAQVAFVGGLLTKVPVGFAQGAFIPVTSASAINWRQLVPAQGFASFDNSGELRPWHFQRRALQAEDVAIEIKYCGVCHSDIHTGQGHWGEQRYPLITGHEITGIVQAVGSAVTRYKVGDRVGVGCLVDSCGHCAECQEGLEQYCSTGATFTYGSATEEQLNPGGITQGGYSNRIVVKQDFVLRIPEAMPLEHAGPIMCAAVTVYSPLKHWQIGTGKKIAVVGMGGLGHLAVKLAKARGAEVVVFTTSADKVNDAKRFGATDVVVNFDSEKIATLRRQFDFILATVPQQFALDPLMPTLKLNATLCLVGIGDVQYPNQLSPFSTISGRNAFAGSLIGSIAETQEVVDFCAEQGIRPEIELITPQQITQSWKNVVAKKARYRYVIDMSKL